MDVYLDPQIPASGKIADSVGLLDLSFRTENATIGAFSLFHAQHENDMRNPSKQKITRDSSPPTVKTVGYVSFYLPRQMFLKSSSEGQNDIEAWVSTHAGLARISAPSE